MKKNYPKILAVTLLVILAVLAVLAGTDTLKDFLEKYKSSAVGSAVVEAETAIGKEQVANIDEENGSTTVAEKPSIQEAELENETTTSNNLLPVLPIVATQDECYNWINSVTLDADVNLLASYSTVVGVFVVIATYNSEYGVVVIKLTQDGMITDITTINVAKDTEYSSSCVSSDGLIVAMLNKERTYVVTMDYETLEQTVLEISLYNNAKLFALEKGVLLLAEGQENYAYLIQYSTIKQSAKIDAGQIVDVFENANSYRLFINQDGYYSVIDLSKTLFGFSKVTIPNRILLDILPIVYENRQQYMAIERANGTIQVVKYENSFSQDTAISVSLGIGTIAYGYVNEENLLILLKNSTTRLYLADKDLNFSLSTRDVFGNPDEIFGAESYNEGFMFLTSSLSEGVLTIATIKNDGTICKKALQTATKYAEFLRTIDGGAIIIYEDGKKITMAKATFD